MSPLTFSYVTMKCKPINMKKELITTKNKKLDHVTSKAHTMKIVTMKIPTMKNLKTYINKLNTMN